MLIACLSVQTLLRSTTHLRINQNTTFFDVFGHFPTFETLLNALFGHSAADEPQFDVSTMFSAEPSARGLSEFLTLRAAAHCAEPLRLTFNLNPLSSQFGLGFAIDVSRGNADLRGLSSSINATTSTAQLFSLVTPARLPGLQKALAPLNSTALTQLGSNLEFGAVFNVSLLGLDLSYALANRALPRARDIFLNVDNLAVQFSLVARHLDLAIGPLSKLLSLVGRIRRWISCRRLPGLHQGFISVNLAATLSGTKLTSTNLTSTIRSLPRVVRFSGAVLAELPLRLASFDQVIRAVAPLSTHTRSNRAL